MKNENLFGKRLYLLVAISLFIAVFFFLLSKPTRQDKLLYNGEITSWRNTGNGSKGKLPILYHTEKINPSSISSQILSSPSLNSKKKKVDFKDLKRSLEKELKMFPGDASLVFYDYETGEKIEINWDEVFESASLVKIPIMIDIYRKIQKKEITPEKKLTLKDSDKTGGSGILKNKPAGSSWQVKKLVELMIAESDNTATDMLIDLAGMKDVEKTAGKIGMKNTTLRRKIYDFDLIDRSNDNFTTPSDMLVALREIYGGNFIDEKYRNEMLCILKKQKNRKMIPAFLPKNVKCAHKTGGLLGIVHDCGIIYPSGRKPYILVLMSKNVTDAQRAEKIFATISKIIFQNLQEEIK